jgi:DNA-binding phage protein
MSKRRRIIRPATEEERARHAAARRQVEKDFQQLPKPREASAQNRIAAAIRKARTGQGLTWTAVAKKAGLRSASTVRDIEYGGDAKLSNVQAVASALGLTLELLEVSP